VDKLKLLKSRISVLLLLLCIQIFSSCANALSETIIQSVVSTNRPEINIYPDFPTLGTDTRLVVEFNKPIDKGSLVLSGRLGDAAEVYWTYHTTTETEISTQLSLWPKTSWPIGSEGVLTISCIDTEGYASEITTRIFGVIGDSIYVDPGGSDENPGTPEQPMASIEHAEMTANTMNLNWTSIPVTKIKLAKGIYNENEIGIHTGMTIDGGWKADWSVQNTDLYESILTPDFTGMAGTSTTHSVFNLFEGGNETVVQNFTIDIRNAPDEVEGISIIDCSPRINNMKITITDSETVYAIASSGRSAPKITNCQIQISDTLSCIGIACISAITDQTIVESVDIEISNCEMGNGIFINNTYFSLTNSRITMSGGSDGFGLLSSASDSIIRNNIIETYSDGIAFDDTPGPITLVDSSSIIQNNTFIFQRFGIGAGLRSNPEVENNLFIFRDTPAPTGPITDGASYYASTADSDPSIFNNNHFSNYDRIYLYAVGDGTFAYFSDAMLTNLETAMNNMNVQSANNTITTTNESAMFNIDWSLTSSASTDITDGGLNLSGEFTTDISDMLRPAAGAWSVGAYQIP